MKPDLFANESDKLNALMFDDGDSDDEGDERDSNDSSSEANEPDPASPLVSSSSMNRVMDTAPSASSA